MASASPSPKSPEQTEKSKRYDRQLRLWGDHGQNRIESSRICLINGNATGTEILKSLILPGCGAFTIVDEHIVTQEDVGNNFFLDTDSIGKNRGECARSLLLELNPDVSGDSIDSSLENILDQDPSFFNTFSIVIGTQLSEKNLLLLSSTLWKSGTPFIYCHSIGFLGWIRIQLNEHQIIESHPDSIIEDLRLDAPFQELTNYMDSIFLQSRDDAVKMPWLVVLYKAIEAYLLSESGSQRIEPVNGSFSQAGLTLMDTNDHIHPCRMNSRQKQEFKAYLREYLGKLGLNANDDVYEETLKAVNIALKKTSIPSRVQSILNDAKANDGSNTSKFWIMVAALKEFVGVNGTLPLRGTVPDMTADSQNYITLQNIYRDKAIKDADDVFSYCQQILRRMGPNTRITLRHDDVRLFCKESHNLHVIRGSSIYDELKSSPSTILNELAQNSEDCDEEKMFYLILRGNLRFHAEENMYPGAISDYEPDIIRFKQVMAKLLNEWNSSLSIKEDFIHEIVRTGASELPSVAAFVGGCVAHEVIKILTCQYVPLHNTMIYNGINSVTSSFII